MKRALGALALAFLYLVIGVAPLSLMIVGSHPSPRPFLVELSVALGFVGLSILGLQFALVARFKSAAAPFGIDVLQRFHKEISFISLAFILAHPILLATQNAARYLPLLVIGTAPWRARFGVISLLLLLLLVSLSVWRRKLRIPYEMWQLSHGMLALAVVTSALVLGACGGGGSPSGSPATTAPAPGSGVKAGAGGSIGGPVNTARQTVDQLNQQQRQEEQQTGG